MTAQDLLERLREFDLLLITDPKFPSITGYVAGGAVRGSWWGHPKSHEIFRLASALDDHPDVLAIKLISGKVTLIHRPLWPAIVAIGSAREPWQIQGLPAKARALLTKLYGAGKIAATGDAVRELEARLLAHAENVHTESGSHAKHVESWMAWRESRGLAEVKLTAAEAKAQLESIVARLNKQFGAKATLPWQTKTRRSHKRP